ncbi:hypothetical protein PHISCL_03257 [Aspergillus sclerotialis]|uniref:Rhodopsin domain-containing protein n=1 Tax=Aspergillus sclerotialis TaxID=2070753 RepID=A0A3A2ZQ45_9EURO|nr:hypothetical protein PHISCL_03257 [Aspergillus sclerotialis]
MSSLGPAFAHEFRRETWALYAVGILGATLRFVARIRRLGVRNLQIDDYMMAFAVIWYTMLCVALNQVVTLGGSNLMDEYDIKHLTPTLKSERVSGSKWVYVSEHSFLLNSWTLKSCMLVLYARITEGLSQKRLVHYLAIYVACGFVATELSLFLICRPITNYWAVPTPNPQCANYQYYEIIQGCIAITADVLMLLVAIPIIIRVRVPLKQKLILLLIFGLGIFVIIAALLTKIYCLVPSLISYVYMNWYFREATVAMLVTNLPLVWSLIREIFPAIRSWTGSKRSDRYRSGPWTWNKGLGTSQRYGRSAGAQSRDFSMHNYGQSAVVTPSKAVSDFTCRASEERDAVSDDASGRALRIRQDFTITIDSEPPDYTTSHEPGQSPGPGDSRPQSKNSNV